MSEDANALSDEQKAAVAVLANEWRIGGPAFSNRHWTYALRGVLALSDAGYDIVKRPIGPESVTT